MTTRIPLGCFMWTFPGVGAPSPMLVLGFHTRSSGRTVLEIVLLPANWGPTFGCDFYFWTATATGCVCVSAIATWPLGTCGRAPACGQRSRSRPAPLVVVFLLVLARMAGVVLVVVRWPAGTVTAAATVRGAMVGAWSAATPVHAVDSWSGYGCWKHWSWSDGRSCRFSPYGCKNWILGGRQKEMSTQKIYFFVNRNLQNLKTKIKSNNLNVHFVNHDHDIVIVNEHFSYMKWFSLPQMKHQRSYQENFPADFIVDSF